MESLFSFGRDAQYYYFFPKRVNELQSSYRKERQCMLATGEREFGNGANQMINLQWSRATSRSSHYDSIKSFIDMYGATCKVLKYSCNNYSNGISQAEAHGACKKLMSIMFIFIMHLMHRIMRITDVLCQTLQKRSQDIWLLWDLCLPQNNFFKNWEITIGKNSFNKWNLFA